MSDILLRLASQLNIKRSQVENTVKLIDDGNTIPFIARYRKEVTGGLDDQQLRELFDRLTYLRNLEQRREEVRRLIESQDKLSGEVEEALSKAETLQEIEDIYRPFKPKRRTRASIAREKGLEPLATVIYAQSQKTGDAAEVAALYIDEEKGVNSTEEAIAGALDIIAEMISDNAEYRKAIREMTFREGILVTSAKKEEDSPYQMYYDFKEPVARIAPHRVLAINRGEREGYLSVKLDPPEERILDWLKSRSVLKDASIFKTYVERAVEDAYSRLIKPSIENEIRSSLTETASEQAIKVFAENLRNLLLQPPVKGKVVLGMDPAYRTGVKLAVVSETGKVLYTGVIYPTPPQNRTEESGKVVKALIEKYGVEVIAIGNGTASRETEIFTAGVIREMNRGVKYMVVSEAGASVYSASKLGSEEFPDLDASLRSAVSIARRLQDPLAELVKIDPKAIGVGQYQHDMNQKRLGQTLSGVVEDCVNSVGVDLNTASAALLSHVAGINTAIAQNIVVWREENGSFKSRKELLKVSKLGAKTFEQCAGFLRIPGAKNILDNTSVHPESYEGCEKLLKLTGHTLEDVAERRLTDIQKKVSEIGLEEVAQKIGIGVPTLADILRELMKPGRDPRDELPPPLMTEDIMEMEDLKPGMVLNGTVRNVVDFGAFVDIGVHQDGLVHISELCDRFVRNAMEVVSVGDIVKVRVLDVDLKRKRISLSMKNIE
ncbi:MAG: RNA-binding transcriptional accessory protein [Clostridiaceae bacterium]|nr:Tex family protein [Bacillota bacterium]NLI38559.1 RNA-binding transcriptional accessory protein [Clostridiaceae bacterium]